ncbi:MAG: hypothetical protein IT281_09580 [Ignavibacteria bacterium]|nr:hypothetical protein [Ignavibacteria bacterium]
MNITKDSPKVQNAFAFLLIFCAVLLLFRGLFAGNIIATNDVSTNDLLHLHLPIRTLYSEALKQGELLQWTPYIYGGFPIFAEGQGGFLYPVNLLLGVLFDPVVSMNVFIILHALLMGIGVYLLTSLLTKNRLLSIPSAAVAAICGSVIAGHTRHLNSLTGIVFLPWLIFNVELFLNSKKISAGLLFGILLGFMFLGGHLQHLFISVFFSFVYMFLRIVFEREIKLSLVKKLLHYKVFQFLGIGIMLSLIIGLPQILSTSELIPFTERGKELTSEFAGMGSMPFSGILTFVYPYYMGNAGDLSFKSPDVFLFWEFFHYSGAIVFILAIIGFTANRKKKEFRGVVWPLLIIAILSYLLSLGDNFPIYKIFSLFPVTKAFRFPVRWLAGMELSVLVLSGFGVRSIAEYIAGKKNVKPVTKKAKNVKAAPVKIVLPDIASQYKISLVIAFVVVGEIFLVAGKQVTTASPDIYLKPPSYSEKIKSDNSRLYVLSRNEFLTEVYEKSRGWEGSHDLYGLSAKLLPPNIGAYFGVHMIDGYLLLVPDFIYEVWGNANNSGIVGRTAGLVKNNFQPTPKFTKLCELFGVKYLSSVWNVSKPFEQVWDSAGVKAYRLPETLNKSWVVSKVESFGVSSNKGNAPKLIDDNFDPKSMAYVNGAVPQLPADSKNGTAEVLSEDNHSITIKANEPGFVVLNDTWFPRWKAFIDGTEVPVYQTDVMIRGVVSPKAGTIIEFRYDKGSTGMLFIFSYLAVLLSAAYLFYEKKKSNTIT